MSAAMAARAADVRRVGSGNGSGPTAVRRRKGRVVAGVAAVVVGGWVFAALYLSAGDRVEVVALASSVQRHDRIDRSDLRVVRIGVTGEDVNVVPVSELEGLVGGLASSDMTAGTVLAPGQITRGGARVLGDDEVVVAVVMAAGSHPSGLGRGDQVLLAMRPTKGDGGPISELDGWVYRADHDPLTSGDQPIEVAVTRTQAAALAVAAADHRVTVVALPN